MLLLIASFGALSGLYVLLDAPFVAVIQIIVYAGAIMVLFLFVVMLLNAPHEDTEYDERVHPLLRPGPMRFGAVLALALVRRAVLGADQRGGDIRRVSRRRGHARSRAIGRPLFTDYAFPFEVTSVLILVAMVGAVVLARRDHRERPPRSGTELMVTLNHYLILSAILFAIGTAGVFVRRNLITILLSIEIMLNAVNLTFVAFGRALGSADGQIIVFFVMTVAAAEAAVGLAIVIACSGTGSRSTPTVHDAEMVSDARDG